MTEGGGRGEDPELPRPPGAVRAFWARRPRLTDGAAALAALLFGYLQSNDVGLSAPLLEQLDGPWFAITVVTAAVLLLRRRHPVPVLVTVITGDVLLVLWQQVPMWLAVGVALYTLAVARTTRAAALAAAAACAAVTVAALVVQAPVGIPVLYAVSALIALLAGANVGNRRRYLAAVVNRAHQLARERDQQAQIAAAAERSRIARELHDIVAHSLTVVVRLSDGAVAVGATDPALAQNAVQQIGTIGRDALVDMRRLLGVLRDDGNADLAPQPTLAHLDQLLGTYRAAGLPVVVRREGDESVSTGRQLLVYRAVQEALTNALRHAHHPSEVVVSLRFTARLIDVRVTDDGTSGVATDQLGGHRGLAGLSERAALYGGTVTAGPRTGSDRGWQVHLVLPRSEEVGP